MNCDIPDDVGLFTSFSFEPVEMCGDLTSAKLVRKSVAVDGFDFRTRPSAQAINVSTQLTDRPGLYPAPKEDLGTCLDARADSALVKLFHPARDGCSK